MLGMDKNKVFKQIKNELAVKKSQLELIEDEEKREKAKTLMDELEKAMDEGDMLEAISVSKKLKQLDKEIEW